MRSRRARRSFRLMLKVDLVLRPREGASTEGHQRRRKEENEDSGSTELAEVLPDEALRSGSGRSVAERSRENEVPGRFRDQSPFTSPSHLTFRLLRRHMR
jgi:hypothetical protein